MNSTGRPTTKTRRSSPRSRPTAAPACICWASSRISGDRRDEWIFPSWGRFAGLDTRSRHLGRKQNGSPLDFRQHPVARLQPSPSFSPRRTSPPKLYQAHRRRGHPSDCAGRVRRVHPGHRGHGWADSSDSAREAGRVANRPAGTGQPSSHPQAVTDVERTCGNNQNKLTLGENHWREGGSRASWGDASVCLRCVVV